MQLALLRRRLPRRRCECHPTKETGARRWRGGCAFLHAAPDASPDTAPDSALDAAIDAARRCATGAALRHVGRRRVLFSGASGEGKWETGQRQGA